MPRHVSTVESPSQYGTRFRLFVMHFIKRGSFTGFLYNYCRWLRRRRGLPLQIDLREMRSLDCRSMLTLSLPRREAFWGWHDEFSIRGRLRRLPAMPVISPFKDWRFLPCRNATPPARFEYYSRRRPSIDLLKRCRVISASTLIDSLYITSGAIPGLTLLLAHYRVIANIASALSQLWFISFISSYWSMSKLIWDAADNILILIYHLGPTRCLPPRWHICRFHGPAFTSPHQHHIAP